MNLVTLEDSILDTRVLLGKTLWFTAGGYIKTYMKRYTSEFITNQISIGVMSEISQNENS